MEPRIIKEENILLVGMSFYGDPFSKATGWTEENEIGILWKRFMGFIYENDGCIKHKRYEDVLLEVHIETDETNEKGIYEIFVGTIVTKIEDVPIQCVIKQLPATQYAVFTLKGKEIISDWEREIFDIWWPASGYEKSYNYGIQYYDARFKGMDNIEQSELDIYIPVKNI